MIFFTAMPECNLLSPLRLFLHALLGSVKLQKQGGGLGMTHPSVLIDASNHDGI